MVLILDRYAVHRSAAAYFLTHHPDWFAFERLQAYAPKLNPVEQSWKRTKYDDLPNFIPENVDGLSDKVHTSQESQHRDQFILRSFFNYAKLPLLNGPLTT